MQHPHHEPLKQWLLISSGQPENRYGPSVDEILKSEGLNGFSLHDLRTGIPDFTPQDLAILTRCQVTTQEAEALKNAVGQGLRLVCLQPYWNLTKLFGWVPAKQVLHPGWVRIREGYPGAGETLQTHVPVALYDPVDATEYSIVADAIDAAWEMSSFPAVVRQSFGAGEVVFFFYDLPKAVARIRFGDPELASQLTTGAWEWLHAIDLFMGHVDERVLHLPQAEMHTQLLAKVLTEICAYPLARLWYFEKAEQCAAANFSSDDDWSTPEQFRDLSDTLVQRGGKATFYLVGDTALSDDEVQEYRDMGHSFGPHVNAASAKGEIPFRFPEELRKHSAEFLARYGESSVSLQCHCAPWQGYMDWLPNFVVEGYRMLYNYISHPQWLNLFMCGAGRPLKFVDEDGVIFDCWQQPMQSYDDATLVERIGEDLPAVVAEFATLLRASNERFHTAIGIGSHPVSFSTYSKPFLTACFDLLKEAGVPIYSGDDWCRYCDRRHAITMQYFRGPDGALHLQMENVEGGFTLMIPAPENTVITINDEAAQTVRLRRLADEYLFMSISSDETSCIDVTYKTDGHVLNTQ